MNLKKKGTSYVDIPSPEEVHKMYRVASGILLSLSDNPRAETLSWQTYIRYSS